MIMTSLGQIANEMAKHIYRNERHIVDAMVKAGKILAEQADKIWARRVAEELIKNSIKIPEKILKLIR